MRIAVVKNFFIITFCLLAVACQTNQTNIDQPNITGVYTGPTIGSKVKLTDDGQCIARNLSFLVGQPESALGAMEYPANTRIIFLDRNESIENTNSKRLSIIVGSQKKIVSVYCG
tara:strand:- start:544 stop:888 length:345 start_codon:yes stop_codon:yes gene_type:complete